MRELIVLTALTITVLTYVRYSLKERSWFNVLTPELFVAIPSLYIAQLGRLSLGIDQPASVFSWLYVFSCYCLPLVVYAWTISNVGLPASLQIRSRRKVTIGISPWVFLIISVLLYLPVMLKFRADLLNPRAIYEQTRTGYGINFFLSTLFSTLAFVLYLFKTRSPTRRLIFFSICALLTLSHGSKGLVLYLAMIWLLHRRYADNKPLSLKATVSLLVPMAAGMVGLFYFMATGLEIADLVNHIFGYSDYTANGMLVIEDDGPAMYGTLFFEDNFYSRIPRAIYEDKPKEFGSFYLAQKYFPESFLLDQGVPAFGIGVPFSDFKWLTLPIMCTSSFLLGLLAKSLRDSLMRFAHPSDFIVFMFLCGLPLFSVGVGFLLPEHLLVAVLISVMLRFRFLPRRVINYTPTPAVVAV